MTDRHPLMLIILDGWGINPSQEGNAVYLADTPFLDMLMERYPHTQLKCSGESVGLPEGIMGNSEVGHLNIGAGRIVYQDLMRINRSIRDRSFFCNTVLTDIMAAVKTRGTALHLMGLMSDGGVHSHIDHLPALLEMSRSAGIDEVYVHAVMDGRDTPPDSGISYIQKIQAHLDASHHGRIATICGRYFAMDRDQRWDRIEKAYRLYTRADGVRETHPATAVRNAYERNETDEFIQPVSITDSEGTPSGVVKNGDGIIFFNFRPDRAREITRAFTENDFPHFERNPFPKLCGFVCMTQYDEKFKLPTAFPPIYMDHILGDVLSGRGLTQLRIAETEKYAHVTYFFNGGVERPFPGEDRCMIPSPREVATYDLKPEMSAVAVKDEVISRLDSNAYDVVILNFANMDMVGHTGVLEAAVKACETVDRCVQAIVTRLLDIGGTALITADHGNAEMMTHANGTPHTAHSRNPVPLILVDDSRRNVRLRPGILADIAPTILALLGIEPPKEMNGRSLLE